MADYPTIEVDLTSRVGPATDHWREIDELREKYRYFWNSYGPGYWVLTQYDDIREAFNTPEVFCNHSIVPTDPDPAYRFLPSFSDPPQHMKYRHLMNRWFAPAAVRVFAPKIELLARETIAPLVPLGRTDFTVTFGDQYPVKVFLLSMGLPQDDADFFVSCVRRMSGATTGKPEDVARMMEAWGDIATYWTDMLAARRAEPLDPETDFVTHLSRCEMDGAPLPDKDVIDLLVTLTLGSLDTLKSQLGWCMYHLAAHPDDRARLVAEPELIPSAVEEFLRAYPIVGMARKVTRDTDFHGCPMRKDDMVLLTIPAATRDPRQFPDADRVIIDRSPNRHIAFGASEHRCLGSHLARNEMQTALREWLAVIPEFRIDSAEPVKAHGGQISLLSLPWRGTDGPGEAGRVKPAAFEYHAPTSTEEAVALLAELGDDAKVLAGGQSLTPMLAMRLAVFGHLVDVGRIPELQGTSVAGGQLRVGAATRDRHVEHDPEVAAAVPLLALATPWIGHFQIRNRGTVGGSLAHADPAAEYPAVAVALDASFDVVSSRGARSVPAAGFFEGVWTTALAPDELLTAVRFPVWPGRCGFGVKEFARRHGDFAIAGAAAAVRTAADGRIDRCSLALFGLGPTPLRAPAAETALLGTAPGEVGADDVGRLALEGVDDPPDDLHAPAAYRRRVGAAMAAGAWSLALEDLDA